MKSVHQPPHDRPVVLIVLQYQDPPGIIDGKAALWTPATRRSTGSRKCRQANPWINQSLSLQNTQDVLSPKWKCRVDGRGRFCFYIFQGVKRSLPRERQKLRVRAAKENGTPPEPR
jgi:hypothetical protein